MGRKVCCTDPGGNGVFMIFTETNLKGAYVVELQRFEDERGYFARSWCEREFKEHGLDSRLVQCNVSFNRRKGTLRGMHYQVPPFAEAKLTRCTRGALYDVIIDLRPESHTFLRWMAIELTPDNNKMVFIPNGFAHGFQTLEDNTEIFYQMSEFYAPECARGVRWNDPLFSITWPAAERTIAPRDQQYPDAHPAQFQTLVSS
jgi:dTDP-4-dehydrorhamnose 3,5-epimerase